MATWSTEIFVISTIDFNPQHTFLGSFLAQLQIAERRRSQYVLDQCYSFANVIVIEGGGRPEARCALSERTLRWAGQHLLLEFRHAAGEPNWRERLTIGGQMRHDGLLDAGEALDCPWMSASLGRDDGERAALQRVQFVWRQYLAHRQARLQEYDKFWQAPGSLARREWEAHEAARQAIETRPALELER